MRESGFRREITIATLFDESSGDGGRVHFRRPTRRARISIARRFLAWAVILAVWAFVFPSVTKLQGGWRVAYYILSSPLPLVAAFLILNWILILLSRDEMIVDTARATLRIQSRGPFSSEPRDIPFSALRSVELGLFDRDSESWDLRLIFAEGQPEPIGGSDSREDAERAAERLATLLRVPVSTSPPAAV